MPKITDFCSSIYVLGCRLSVVRLCDSDFGITPVYDITIGITCAAFCFHIAHISLLLLLLLFTAIEFSLGGSSPYNYLQELAASSMLHEAKIAYYAFDVIVYCMYTHQTRIAYKKRTH